MGAADDKSGIFEDPAFPRIFDYFDVGTVKWMLGELVKKTQLDGGTLY